MLTLVVAVFAFAFLEGPWRWAAIAGGAAVDIAESLALVHWSRRRRSAVGVETLVGAAGRVVTVCRPNGQVRVAGELWRARCDDGADPGEEVVVTAVDGLTLTVSGPPRGEPQLVTRSTR
jgi:membrane protein implicated in regulation of membrane protease activity